MKFKLTKESKGKWGIKLYRIEATKDFGDVAKGKKGGWVEKEDNLSQENNAWVSGNAEVSGDARVYGDAEVYGDAWVYGDAEVSGELKLEFGWCFGRKRADWDVTELENEEEILLIKDYKPAEEKDKVEIVVEGKKTFISRESAKALKLIK